MSHIYPPIKTYHREMLDVGDGHQIYLEQSGNPEGLPVLYLHGGPGAGLSPMYRSFFNPEVYRIIGFDQRGCGQSLPFAKLEHNTTDHLLADIEFIRKHLGIKKWMLCGGSWGTTLALLSAIAKPEAVSAIILRGVFLGRKQDFEWFIEQSGGAAQLFPEYYDEFVGMVKNGAKDLSVTDRFYQIFLHGDELSRVHAAKSWCMWEERISVLNSTVKEHDFHQNLSRAASLALLECHYIKNNCFIIENQILQNIHKIDSIPGTIIHGRFDIVCKMENAYTLSNAWREGQLLVVPEAGHSASDPRISDAICHATDRMAKFLTEKQS
ncbi:prolyl aminopeptidase [Aliiglaciecola sp. SL4]|uniref:prolyl aminopeptidase n=1 Tax=Aliiglaciecola sp. SL4 TaxID=3239806 RepID=UPI00355B3807